MMNTNKQKKSLGFLSIVAFLMILVGVGYTVSSVLAGGNTVSIPSQSENSLGGAQDLINTEDEQLPKENFFSSLERQVAQKATSLWNDMLGNVHDTPPETPSVIDNQNYFSDNHNTLATLIKLTPHPLPLVYTDIQHSKYQNAILTLYSHGLIHKGEKFYPDNHVRISDFIRVVMDAYRLGNHYDIANLEGLTEKMYFSSNMPKEVLMRINSAYEGGFLTQLDLEDIDGNSRWDVFISPIEAKEILLAIQKKSPVIVRTIPEMAFLSSTTLNRDEMAQLVVSAFGLKLNERSLAVFSDISGTIYQDAIQHLARLGIVGGVNGRFYPDAKVENKDFVIMLTRTLAHQQGKPIVIDNFYYLKPLQNVSTTATYAPHLEYCLEYQMCTSLLTQTPGGVTFQANRLLDRSEVIPIVSTASQTKFHLPDALKGEHITRGELAHLFVNMFQLETQNSYSPMITTENSDGKSRRESFQGLMSIQ